MEMTRRATPVLSQSGSFTWPSNLQEISQPTSSVRGGYSTSPAYATGACDLPAGLGVSQNPLTHPQATRLPSQDGSPRSWPLAASISAVPPELLSSDLCRPWSLAVDDLQLCSAQVVSTGGINGSQEVLGVGPWGPVYKGLLYKTDMVAIRKVGAPACCCLLTRLGLSAAASPWLMRSQLLQFPLRGDKEHLSATMSALDHLHSLRHPSLVMFLGAAVLQDEIWLVSELVDGAAASHVHLPDALGTRVVPSPQSEPSPPLHLLHPSWQSNLLNQQPRALSKHFHTSNPTWLSPFAL